MELFLNCGWRMILDPIFPRLIDSMLEKIAVVLKAKQCIKTFNSMKSSGLQCLKSPIFLCRSQFHRFPVPANPIKAIGLKEQPIMFMPKYCNH